MLPSHRKSSSSFFFFSKLQEKVYLESHRGRNSEQWKNGLRKQAMEAQKGPVELRGERGSGNTPAGSVLLGGRAPHVWFTWIRCVCGAFIILIERM